MASINNVTSIGQKAPRRATADEAAGMMWWNAMTERERLEALRAADTACPAEAFNHWRNGFKCEESAHG